MAFEKFDLSGKTALVTGGATGLGFQMARALVHAGAKVVIAARREQMLDQAAKRLGAESSNADVDWHPVDLVDRDSVRALADHVLGKHGGVDIFIGNAGATYTQQILDIDTRSLDDVFQLNLIANIQLAQAFLPGMKERKWGRIIFSSSIGSVMALPLEGTVAYNATKAGLNAVARGVAADMGQYNITANALVLGLFLTDILKDALQQLRETRGEQAAQQLLEGFTTCTALGRLGNPDEVEGLVQLLASDAGSYITGASLAIDGGMSIMMLPRKSGA